MEIAVVGLGYVGLTSAVCLAQAGHAIWGVDQDETKVKWISAGISPIEEPDIEQLLKHAVRANRLQALTEISEAVARTDLALICVGTPTDEDGFTDLRSLKRVIRGIAEALQKLPYPYTIVVRSTIPPGTMTRVVLPSLMRDYGSGCQLKVCFNPEFLREGSAVQDFYNPPFTIIGVEDVDGPDSEDLVNTLRSLYKGVTAPVVTMQYVEAELLKLVCNAFHGLKVAFANEIGVLATKIGADTHRLMKAFVLDTKLNISPAYLSPGFAFGGSCLPKDIRALVRLAVTNGCNLPIFEAILPSNDAHLSRGVERILAHNAGIVGLAGAAFKSGTGDLRESPYIRLARRLIDAGCTVLIYEPEIDLDRLIGANLLYLQELLPNYRSIFVSWTALQETAELIVETRKGVISARDKTKVNVPIVRLYQLVMENHAQCASAL